MAVQEQLIKVESDYMTQDVVKLVNEAQLIALKETLERFHVPARDYALLEDPKDDSVCLSCREGKWVTFTFEKGSESNPMVFASIEPAVLDVIDNLSDNAVEMEQMKQYYQDALRNSQAYQTPASSLYTAILKRLKQFANAVAIL